MGAGTTTVAASLTAPVFQGTLGSAPRRTLGLGGGGGLAPVLSVAAERREVVELPLVVPLVPWLLTMRREETVTFLVLLAAPAPGAEASVGLGMMATGTCAARRGAARHRWSAGPASLAAAGPPVQCVHRCGGGGAQAAPALSPASSKAAAGCWLLVQQAGWRSSQGGRTFIALGLRIQLTVFTVEFSLATKVTEPCALSCARSSTSLLERPASLLSRPRPPRLAGGGGGGGGGGGSGLGGRPRNDLRAAAAGGWGGGDGQAGAGRGGRACACTAGVDGELRRALVRGPGALTLSAAPGPWQMAGARI